MPMVEDYGTVLSKPGITLVRTLPPQETAEYLKRVAAFQKKHAGLLMSGVLTDSEGFTFRGQGIVAKGYQAPGALGIRLWNTTEKPAAFEVSVPKAELVTASEPEWDQVEAFSELAPQTVRLLVWKTK